MGRKCLVKRKQQLLTGHMFWIKGYKSLLHISHSSSVLYMGITFQSKNIKKKTLFRPYNQAPYFRKILKWNFATWISCTLKNNYRSYETCSIARCAASTCHMPFEWFILWYTSFKTWCKFLCIIYVRLL